MSSKRIVVNPDVLKWARETAHLAVGDVPKSIVDTERLLKIESGEELPTMVLLEKLAKKYDRSSYTLLGSKIPKDDYLELPFFRQQNKTDYDSALALFIRELQKKQDWARNFLLSEGHVELDFVGTVKLRDNHFSVASKIKDRFNMPSFADFSGKKKKENYFKALKKRVEANNVFVSISGSDKSNNSISLQQAQGFAIVDDVAPFIFVNTKNTINAKIFTLIHEVVHLFIAESGISENSVKFRTSDSYEDKVENFCNMVAGEILMPKDIFVAKFKEGKGMDLYKLIDFLADYFSVSELAICVRLWKLHLIPFDDYSKAYETIDKEIKAFLKRKMDKLKEKKSGGNYYATMAFRNGEMFSQIAYYAYKEDKILGTDLYKLLRIKLDNFGKYNEYFLAV